MAFTARLNGYPLYRYIPQRDWPDIDRSGFVPAITSGRIFLTPHFFRFSDEARKLLALPSKNLAEIGVYIDPNYWISLGLTPIYHAMMPMYGVAGFGLEIILTNPIPRSAVIERFEMENASLVSYTTWNFGFTSV